MVVVTAIRCSVVSPRSRRSFTDEDVPGVEHRGDDAERVAEERGRREAEAGAHQHGDAGERGGEAGEEQAASAAAGTADQTASVTKIEARLASSVEFATEVYWIE